MPKCGFDITSALLLLTLLKMNPNTRISFISSFYTLFSLTEVNVTPKSFSLSNLAKSSLFIVYLMCGLSLPMLSTLHLLLLNCICHLSAHSYIISKSDCSAVVSASDPIILPIFASSANLQVRINLTNNRYDQVLRFNTKVVVVN